MMSRAEVVRKPQAVVDFLRVSSVADVMTSRVYSVTPEWTLLATAQLLRRHHISGVPVTNRQGLLVGVVSETDVVTDLFRAQGLGTVRGLLDLLLEAARLRRSHLVSNAIRRLQRAKVGLVMSRKPVTVEPDATLSEAARLLRQYEVNRLPVIQDGRLVGIVTRQDIVESVSRSGSSRPFGRSRRFSRGPPSMESGGGRTPARSESLPPDRPL